MFCSKNVGVMPGLIVLDSKLILKLPRCSKEQRVWVCLEHARFQNAAEFGVGWP